MVIEDVVMGSCAIVFSIALLPQIYRNFIAKAPSVSSYTSGLTFICLIVMSICSYRLGIIYNSISTLINASLWAILLLQNLIYGRMDAKSCTAKTCSQRVINEKTG